MKYLITGHKFGDMKRGGYTIPQRFCLEHSEFCEFKEDRKVIRRLKSLNEKYRKLIFWTQVPKCYTPKLYFTKFRFLNHIFYLRNEHLNPLYISCQNGFHYYREHEKIKFFVPMITEFSVSKSPKDICLGFYCREWLTPDSFECFLDILSSLKFKANVCIMGDESEDIKNHPNVLSYKHTHSNIEFFETITHYFYPTSRYFSDPFPHSVLEAVQSGRQIIFPEIKRDHKDGIDDIKDCIEWHEKLDLDKYLDNSNCLLNPKNFKGFYKRVFENNFEYEFNRDRYKNMKDWIVSEVL